VPCEDKTETLHLVQRLFGARREMNCHLREEVGRKGGRKGGREGGREGSARES